MHHRTSFHWLAFCLFFKYLWLVYQNNQNRHHSCGIYLSLTFGPVPSRHARSARGSRWSHVTSLTWRSLLPWFACKLSEGNITLLQVVRRNVTLLQVVRGNITLLQVVRGNVTLLQVVRGNVTLLQVVRRNVTLLQVVRGNITLLQVVRRNTTLL